MYTDPVQIGRYEIERCLGRGGMGVVYLAHDPLLTRAVAIKVLVADTEMLRARFAREARSAAALKHPHIITIHDIGEDQGRPFLAMEYLEGPTLAELRQTGVPLSLGKKLELAIALCEGLDYAHERGVVHRDVKPTNLMVDARGVLKILDFGLARITEEASAEGLTLSGMLLGTPRYMSPELIQGGAIDHRSDIFSVGVILYELLADQRAFPGDVTPQILYNIVHTEPAPLLSLRPDLDPALERITKQAIAKVPGDRYSSLARMASDLRGALERLRAHATVIPAKAVAPPIGTSQPAGPSIVAPEASLEVIAPTPETSSVVAEPAKPTVTPVPAVSRQPPAAISLSRGVRVVVLSGFAVVAVFVAVLLIFSSVGSDEVDPRRAAAPGVIEANRRVLTAQELYARKDVLTAVQSALSALEVQPEHPGALRLLQQARDEARQGALLAQSKAERAGASDSLMFADGAAQLSDAERLGTNDSYEAVSSFLEATDAFNAAANEPSPAELPSPSSSGVTTAAVAPPGPAPARKPGPSASPAKADAAQRVRVLKSGRGFVNVRQKPDIDSPVVGRAKSGEVYAVSETTNGWHRLDAVKGWIAGYYVRHE